METEAGGTRDNEPSDEAIRHVTPDSRISPLPRLWLLGL